MRPVTPPGTAGKKDVKENFGDYSITEDASGPAMAKFFYGGV